MSTGERRIEEKYGTKVTIHWFDNLFYPGFFTLLYLTWFSIFIFISLFLHV